MGSVVDAYDRDPSDASGWGGLGSAGQTNEVDWLEEIRAG